MARSTDPLRLQVEATLQRLVGAAATAPCELLRVARRTVGESVGLARTVLNLTVDGLLGWEVDAGVPRLEPVGTGIQPSSAPLGEGAASRRSPPAPSSNRAGAADLPIPGYEDLAASHIVARLDRLSPSELAEIRAFEVVNRGRRTVVGKIDQLLAHQ
jgi:hypothetical protein